MVSIWNKIASNEAFEPNELSYIEKQVKLHPYISAFHAMLAKHHLTLESGLADDNVKQAALRSQSRAQLHAYLYGPTTSQKPQPTAVESREDRPEKEQYVAELNDQLIASALGSGLAIELLAEDSDESSDIPVQEAVDSNKRALEKNIEEKEEEATESTISDSEPTEMSFASWMSVLSDSPPYEEQVPKQLEPTTNISKEVSSSIVDHFLDHEEEIVPKRAEFYSPVKAAKASLKDNDELVTETLAGVYVSQGNIDKAISTYEKLSLLNPEKSAYFAALIQKLNNSK